MGGQEPSRELAERLRLSVDASCAEAARRIAQADVFLMCTGAGFSADSGLAVYADVAKVDAYAKRSLEYHDICQPQWLTREPELFWGFWGQCFNDYRETAPHEGYQIVDRWANSRFRNSHIADSIRKSLEDAASHATDGLPAPPYSVTDYAGAFFAFTSNVDAHHFDWFRASEIHECHGNTELYQCTTDNEECQISWRAPRDFKFHVDKSSMLAKEGASVEVVDNHTMVHNGCTQQESVEVVPRIGMVRGGGRPHALRNMPGNTPSATEAGFLSNHPRCPLCNAPARPAILMFGDSGWKDDVAQEARWEAWISAVEKEIKSLASMRRVRVVILEMGAGCNVRTVRQTSESVLKKFRASGANATLVRVSPDIPLADDSRLRSDDDPLAGLVLSIMCRGLESLRKIDSAMSALDMGAPDVPEQPSKERFMHMKSAFECQSSGELTVPVSEVYNILFSDTEQALYKLSDFIGDLDGLDMASEENLTWQDIELFFAFRS